MPLRGPHTVSDKAIQWITLVICLLIIALDWLINTLELLLM